MASTIDLKQCDPICMGCVKGYKKKHSEEPSFDVSCGGIPLEYVPKHVLAILDDSESKAAIGVMDPVVWAAEVLDWHCIDPDGVVWKRKSKENKLPQGVPNYYDDIPAGDIRISHGKSPFHRPYQREMLACTAKRKVFRCGRQLGKSEVLIVSILHKIFTNKEFRVLLLTPFSSQVDLIFKRIEEFLQNNDVLYNSKKRLVRAPNYTLELYNGSVVKGFTAGTQSKGNAVALRGQTANMLVFDEADYLSSADLDSALAVITNFPTATVWMSSTPSGKRERYYEVCKSKMYKEFYYPSQVNPNWTKELEEYFRSSYTEIGYQHEVLATWGEQEQGVFQAAYVDAAKESTYKYGDHIRSAGWSYCVGVDWNDTKIGTTIAVVGYNPSRQKYQLVDRVVVSREGWTQLAACEKIVELNRKWIPNFIYIDRGYGSTQDEILRKFGHDAAIREGSGSINARLSKIVKAYDFGGTVEIRDLFTKLPIKKAAKPFLVENTVRRFETRNIGFPSSDKQLEEELLGYIIDRFTPTGLPVYKQGNTKAGDHNLDALMLALVAFELEFTQFGTPKYAPHIAFSGHIGELTDPRGTNGQMGIKRESRTASLEQHQPNFGRTDGLDNANPKDMFKSAEERMPAANTRTGEKPKVWSWDGFNSDRPAPTRMNRSSLLKKVTKPGGRNKF